MDNIKRTYLVAPDDLKSATYINYNVDDAMAGSAIRETQEMNIILLLGTNIACYILRPKQQNIFPDFIYFCSPLRGRIFVSKIVIN